MSLLIWSVKVQNSIKRILLFSIILLAGCNAAETKTQQPLSGSEITNTSTDILTSSQTPQPFPTSESTMTPTIENKPGQPTRSTDTNSNTEPSLDQGKILIINPDKSGHDRGSDRSKFPPIPIEYGCLFNRCACRRALA